MQVTLIVDASFCPDTRAAGWGMFASSERGQICSGGTIQRQVNTNNVAECVALINGLNEALRAGIAAEGDIIMCYSDSAYVLDRMKPGQVGPRARKTARETGKPPYFHSHAGDPKRIVFSLLTAYRLTLGVEFINGHTPRRRRGVNDQWMARVDGLSRQFMMEQRNLRVGEAFL